MQWHPIDDRPLSGRRLGALDPGRLGPVIDALQGHLARALEAPRDRPYVQRIGLFGGLGQGKSSVIAEACRLANLHWKQRHWNDSPWRAPIQRFDVSDFKADDLEWRFLTSTLLMRVLKGLVAPVLLVLVSALALGMLACTPYADLCRKAGSLPWGSFGIPSAVVTCLGFLAALYVTPLDRLCLRAARWTRTMPRVVIVDDLDRARIEQQRAFLRAMSRMAAEMRFSVFVCMDESDLLRSTSDPEAPEELLRKTLDLEIHLPDRSREDAVALVVNVARVSLIGNRRLRGVLAHPQWLGDLVRVLLLSGPVGRIGPRQVKRLVNQVGQAACVLNTRAVDDWCALLRLDALYRQVPELRRHSDGLRPALEMHSSTAFDALLERLGAEAAPRAAALRLFEATTMMQPAMDDGWHRLLGGSPDPETGAAAPAGPGRPRVRSCLRLTRGAQRYARLFIEAADLERQGHGSPMLPKLLAAGGWQFATPAIDESFDIAERGQSVAAHPGKLPASWRCAGEKSATMVANEWLCWMAVLAGCSGAERMHALGAMRRWLGASAVAQDFCDLLLREELADSRWIACLDDAAVRPVLLQAHAQRRLRGTALAPAHLHGLLEVLGEQGLADHRIAALALRRVQGRVDRPVRGASARSEPLALLWPSLAADGAETRTLAARLVNMDAGVQLRHLGWQDEVPGTWLHVWHELAAGALTTCDCLNLLYQCGCDGLRHASGALAWDPARLNRWLPQQRALPAALLRITDPPSAWSGAEQPLRDGWLLTALLAAALLDRQPHPALLQWLPGRCDRDLHDLVSLLIGVSPHGAAPSRAGRMWMDPAAKGFLEACLRRVEHLCTSDDRLRWGLALVERADEAGRDPMRDLIYRLGWPPPMQFA